MSRAFGSWLVTLDFIDTDSTGERFFGDVAGERVVLGVSFHVL